MTRPEIALPVRCSTLWNLVYFIPAIPPLFVAAWARAHLLSTYSDWDFWVAFWQGIALFIAICITLLAIGLLWKCNRIPRLVCIKDDEGE